MIFKLVRCACGDTEWTDGFILLSINRFHLMWWKY